MQEKGLMSDHQKTIHPNTTPMNVQEHLCLAKTYCHKIPPRLQGLPRRDSISPSQSGDPHLVSSDQHQCSCSLNWLRCVKQLTEGDVNLRCRQEVPILLPGFRSSSQWIVRTQYQPPFFEAAGRLSGEVQ